MFFIVFPKLMYERTHIKGKSMSYKSYLINIGLVSKI